MTPISNFYQFCVENGLVIDPDRWVKTAHPIYEGHRAERAREPELGFYL